MLNIGLVGADGKMGHTIIECIKGSNVYNLKCAIVSNMSTLSHNIKDFVQICSTDITTLGGTEAVIDFSTPRASLMALSFCVENKLPLVIGTTGFSEEEKLFIQECSEKIPIVFAPNMSLSVNVLYKVVEQVAMQLGDFEVEIIEAHHRNKQDAPSGTALMIGNKIAQVKNLNFETTAKFNRCGVHQRRKKDDIGFSVVRGGDIVGTHDVQFIGDGEILSIKSQINNRGSFAKGALMAASFVVGKPPRLYDMSDVLNGEYKNAV